MINERLDRRLRRGAWAAIAVALLAFTLMAAGCAYPGGGAGLVGDNNGDGTCQWYEDCACLLYPGTFCR